MQHKNFPHAGNCHITPDVRPGVCLFDGDKISITASGSGNTCSAGPHSLPLTATPGTRTLRLARTLGWIPGAVITRQAGCSSARWLPIKRAASAWIAPCLGDAGAIARGVPSISSHRSLSCGFQVRNSSAASWPAVDSPRSCRPPHIQLTSSTPCTEGLTGCVAGSSGPPRSRRRGPGGMTGPLKSFGRRRRTKVADERTRGTRSLVYGECDFWPMRRTVGPSPLHVCRAASLRYWCTARRFLVLE